MFVRERAPGLWIPGSVIDPLEVEHIDRDKERAADMYAGGEYAPLNPLGIGGAGIGLAGQNHKIRTGGKLTVENGGEINTVSGGTWRLSNGALGRIEPGGVLEVEGLSDVGSALIKLLSRGVILAAGTSGHEARIQISTNALLEILTGGKLEVLAGGELTVKASAVLSLLGSLTAGNGGVVTLQSGSQLIGQSGAFVQLSNEAWLANASFVSNSWPKLAPTRTWHRHAARIALCTYNNHAGSGPDDPDAWEVQSDSGDAPCIRTRAAAASGDYHVLEFEDLPEGGNLAEVEIETKGGSNIIPTYPQYRLVRWQTGDSTLTNLSSLVTDVHSSSGNWHTVVGTTTITPNSSVTVDRTFRYGLKVLHPYAVLDSHMRIYRCTANGTAGEIRV